jgi:hypothetical protein
VKTKKIASEIRFGLLKKKWLILKAQLETREIYAK